MNWITKAINFGQKIKKVLKKRLTKEEINSGQFTSCCVGPIEKSKLIENFYQCPDCSKTFPISPKMRFDSLFGANNYEIINTPSVNDEDILKWKDVSGKYIDKLNATKKKTGMNCSIMVAEGKLSKDLDVVAVCSEFKFFGASISMNEGEAILYACSKSIEKKIPLILFVQGGGMKMQTGMYSLYQMPRTVLGISEVKSHNIPVICVVDSVVSGGISASYASIGDFLIYEGKKSKLMFAGPRVIQGTISSGSLPENFQESSFNIDHGFGDFVIEKRIDTKKTLVKLLNILLKIDTSVSSISADETSELNIKTREAS